MDRVKNNKEEFQKTWLTKPIRKNSVIEREATYYNNKMKLNVLL